MFPISGLGGLKCAQYIVIFLKSNRWKREGTTQSHQNNDHSFHHRVKRELLRMITRDQKIISTVHRHPSIAEVQSLGALTAK
jgi:hypothetical protein